jgi:Zn-finger nucleic acid-binding protein
MNCPNCKITMLICQHEEVEIDYCPQCRGVWLDHGELDKITKKSAAGEPKWHAYFSENAVPLFQFKHDKYLSWRFIRFWLTKANISRRIQIDYRT